MNLEIKIKFHARIKSLKETRKRIRLRHFDYEDSGMLERSLAVLAKIDDRIVKLERRCGVIKRKRVAT
jgi:hypothetical protein